MIRDFYPTHRWEPNRYYPPDQNGFGNNDNEVELHIPQSSRTGSSPSYTVYGHTQDTCCARVLHL